MPEVSTDRAGRLASLQDEIAGLRQGVYPDSYDMLDLLAELVSEMQHEKRSTLGMAAKDNER